MPAGTFICLLYIEDLVNDTAALGYYLGQLYLFKLSTDDDDSEGKVIFRIVRKFDAHSRPITGLIVNEDIG